MFRTLADTKNCSSAQMNAVLGLKFVEYDSQEKSRAKSWYRELWQGYKLTVAQLVIKIYSTASGVSRMALISVFSFINMSGRLDICLFILSEW